MAFLQIIPKLPMRDKAQTRRFYCDLLGFVDIGEHDYPDYLLLEKQGLELHFFRFPDLNPLENDGQVYIRMEGLKVYYEKLQSGLLPEQIPGKLAIKPWGQMEFALLDPDHNLLTFGERLLG